MPVECAGAITGLAPHPRLLLRLTLGGRGDGPRGSLNPLDTLDLAPAS